MAQLYKLREDAPYRSWQMPMHQKQSNGNWKYDDYLPNGKRATSGAFKHNLVNEKTGQVTQGGYVAYQMLQHLGEVHTREEWIEIIAGHLRAAPTFGIRGGTQAEVTASQAFKKQYDEDLFIDWPQQTEDAVKLYLDSIAF